MNPNSAFYALPDLDVLRLRFYLTSDQTSQLPEFKGSMLRGAFGAALRKTVCAMDFQSGCSQCMLKTQCAYTCLFETFITGDPPRFLRGLDTAPRPFIIETPDTARTYTPGAPLAFDLILIGSALKYLPYVVFSVLRMAGAGLGVNRSRFTLSGADCWQPVSGQPDADHLPAPTAEWRHFYDQPSQSLLFTPQATPLKSSPVLPESAPKQLKLHFTTPTRLAFDGKYRMDFNFRGLVFKMLRRVLELVWFYMPGAEINWEFHDLLVAADAVAITERRLRHTDWQRYSNRQGAKIDMSGFTGDLVLAGNLAPFLDLLEYIRTLHLGKGTVFGLGQLEVEKK